MWLRTSHIKKENKLKFKIKNNKNGQGKLYS